jgi:PAS domain S-box-containing protein
MPILDKKGNLLGYRGTDTDITERKQLEDDLRSSEEKFRAISASAMNAIILLDEKDRIVYWNPAAEKIFGYTTEEVLGKELGKLVVPPKNRKNHLALLERLVSSKEELSEKRVEIKALRKDGTEFPIELSATTLKLKDKTCVLEIVQDVSERKKLEAEMKQERDMLEAVTENIGAGLIIISKDYHTLWANGFIKRYKGDVEGKLCYATLNTLETICPQCGVKKVFEEGKAIDTHEYSSTDINGNSYTVELIATPIKDKDGKVVAALELAVDITEKKRMQSKLAEYSQKLEKLVEQKTDQLKQTQAKLVKSERLAAIGELAAMVGHDLRNPLTGIKGATYYLRSKCGASTDSRAKGMLKTIEECIDYSNKIVNDLLEYSTEMKLDLTETNAKTLIARSKSIVKYPANVRVVDVVDDEPTIMVDEAKMCRAFGNIIKNAIDAMPEGGTLTITSTKMEDELEIVFRDTGTGMSEETLDKLRLWVPLFTTKAKGMGFGLAICKRIMEAHGGKIRVESQLGKGTTVTVSFPLRPVVTSESEDKWIFSDASLSDAIKT